MKYEASQNLSTTEFKRLFGVKRETFAQMTDLMQQAAQSKGKGGVKAKLSLEDQILVTLQYWREYRTYFHIANDWEVSESTICRIVKKVENVLIKSEKFRLAGKKSLWQKQPSAIIAIDVTETKVERPKHHQKHFYSGRKKHHALKAQFVVDLLVPLTVRASSLISRYSKQVEFIFMNRHKVSRIRVIKVYKSCILTR
jgi:hypothetical protein